ncbi:multidrug resistance protein Fnx1 [Diaporthe sp. PMI_573]|nr:multidrug resistance protein Fnx1 [Diaporthaceae sp. PMI_573]
MASHGWDFWLVMAALSVTSLLSALDISVMSTALPSIVFDLGSSPAYSWVANGYFLTSTAFQPLFGQTANIFGRRTLTLSAVLLFTVGSAISGSAANIAALIAGRLIQGIGGGGLNVMTPIVVADLVPLRDRSRFMSIIFTFYSIAFSIGPVVGGALVDHSSWRWIFYLNLPVAGLSLVLLFFFLHVPYNATFSPNMLRRVDFAGNALLIASVVSVLIALNWAGAEYPWSSWRVIVPLVIGLMGIGGFLILESTTLIPEPTMPFRIFSNRTSLPTFGLAFIQSMLTYWSSYYLPVYFQAVLEATPTQSGVDALPSVFIAMPFAMAAGVGLSALNRFKPFMFFGFALLASGYGMLSLLDQTSSTAYWAASQGMAAAGTGTLMTVTLPAIQAPLAETDQTIATGAWGFVRSFGGIWGVAIPSAVFNSKVNALLYRVSNDTVSNALSDGGAYSLATRSFMRSLNSQPALKSQVLSVYVDSLQLVWQVGIAFSLLGFIITFIVRGMPLRENLERDLEAAEDEKALMPPFHRDLFLSFSEFRTLSGLK